MSNNLADRQKKKKFNELIQDHLDSLLQLAIMRCGNKELAEDLVQDSCLKAYNSFMKKDEISNPKSWLFRILINTHIDYTRKKQLPISDVENLEFASFAEPSKDAERNAFYKDLDKALNELEPDQKTVVYLSDVQEYSYKEIAEIIEIPIGTVMSRLHRARQSLRKILTREGYSDKFARSVE